MVVVDHLVHKYVEILCSVHHGGHPASHHGPPVGEGHGGAVGRRQKYRGQGSDLTRETLMYSRGYSAKARLERLKEIDERHRELSYPAPRGLCV